MCLIFVSNIIQRKFQACAHTWVFADIIATPICKLLRIPLISTCHGFLSHNRTFRLYNSLDRLVLRFFDRIIAVSDDIKKELSQKGIEKSRIVVIQNAVQNYPGEGDATIHRAEKRRHLSIGENEFVIGYAGRLSEEKGVHYLIEAGSELKKGIETFKLVILGNGPKREDLENMVKEKDLGKEIIFTGFQNNIEEWLPALDVFVLPSLTEGTPMALLEAMSVGIPVIASAVGGIPKIVKNGIDGLLINPGDSHDLYDKILLLKNNSILREKMALDGVNKIRKEFDANQWSRKIEDQYDFILGH